jgi:hypothetical protein
MVKLIKFNEKTFDLVFYDFDVNFYKGHKDIKNLSNIEAKRHYINIGRFQGRIYNNKIKILIVCKDWNDDGKFSSGGNKALYNLGKIINQKKYKNIYAKMYDMSGLNKPNPFCNYYATKYEINKQTIVIYSDGMEGNPLNAQNVIRWILLEIGSNYRPADFFTTWNPNDLVYHWEYGNKSPNTVKILNTCTIDSIYINENKEREKDLSCYMIKKRNLINKEILFGHPTSAIQLDNLTKTEIIHYFNICEYFYCYDLNTFFFIGAIICGCKVILIKDNRTKEQFISNSVFVNFPSFINMFSWGIYDLESINYDANDIENLKLYLNNLSNSVDIFLEDIHKLFYSNLNEDIPTVKSVYM